MALIALCENCGDDWPQDNLVGITALNLCLCPNCVNQLVDLCFERLTNPVIRQIRQDLETLA